jgi:hypothetical protein
MEGTREVTRAVDFYNLDIIISMEYRVKSHVATRFRIWATKRLKNPDQPGDYDRVFRILEAVPETEGNKQALSAGKYDGDR